MENKNVRKTISACLWVVTGLILFALVVQIGVVAGFSAKGYHCFAVESGSMQPALPVGALIVVQEIPEDQMQEGQMLTFRSPKDPKKTFTHRAVSIDRKKRTVVTKGDHNKVNDPDSTSLDYCVGKVAYSFPFLGFVYLAAHTTIGVICLGLLLLLWLSFELESIIHRKREAKRHA